MDTKYENVLKLLKEAASMVATDLPSQFQREKRESFKPRLGVIRALTPVLGSHGTMYYAVHDSDLRFFGQSANIALAVIGNLLNIDCILPRLVYILWQYRRKGVELTWQQGVILDILRRGGKEDKHAENRGLPLPRIQKRVKKVIDDDWPEDEIANILKNELMNVELNDKTITNFVECVNGRWRDLDV